MKVAGIQQKIKEGNEKPSVSLENAKKTLKEAKKAGLKTNVKHCYILDDITYAGCRNYQMVGILIQQKKGTGVYKNVIKELKAADAVPTMITIGNEVNYNF